MKPQNKIIFTIVGLIIFFGTLATISTFFLTRDESIKQLSGYLATSNLAQSHESYQLLRQSKELAIMLSQRPAIREYITNPSNATIKKQIENGFLEGYNLDNMYSAIYLLDKNGIGKVSTDPRFVGQDYSFRNYFVDAIAGNTSFAVAMGVTSKELGYYFSAPIYSTKDNMQVTGVAVFKLIPKSIENSLLEHVTTNFNILLTDESGVIILTNDTPKLFSSLGELPEATKNQLTKSNNYGTNNIPTLDYKILMDSIKTIGEDAQTFRFFDKKDNEEEVISMIKIKDFPLYLIIEGKLDEITRSSLQSSAVIAGFVAIAAFASILFIMLILRPILRQQKVTEDRILERTTELEKLNNLMVGRELKMIELKQSIKDLEGKI